MQTGVSVASRFAALVAAIFLCAQAPAPDPVVAQSGPVTLTASALQKLIAGADPAARERLARDPAQLGQLVRAEMLQRVILEKALAAKWDQSPDVAARAAQARDAVIANTWLAAQAQPPADYPSDAEVAAAYEANKSKLMLPRQFHVAQVFVSVPGAAAKAVDDDAQKRAREIRARLARPKAEFADEAKKSDDRATAGKGGDLGWLREDQLVPAIKEALSGLAEGAVSDPVRGRDGWHVLKLLGTRPGAPASLADSRAALVAALRQQRTQAAQRALIEDVVRAQPIQIDEIQLAKLVPAK